MRHRKEKWLNGLDQLNTKTPRPRLLWCCPRTTHSSRYCIPQNLKLIFVGQSIQEMGRDICQRQWQVLRRFLQSHYQTLRIRCSLQRYILHVDFIDPRRRQTHYFQEDRECCCIDGTSHLARGFWSVVASMWEYWDLFQQRSVSWVDKGAIDQILSHCRI